MIKKSQAYRRRTESREITNFIVEYHFNYPFFAVNFSHVCLNYFTLSFSIFVGFNNVSL